jgi:BASS family bile acid:Na+ symporter
MALQIIVGVIAPIVIAISMWGVGLSLSWHDFLKIREKSLMVVLSMFVQLIIVPLFAFTLNWVFQLPSELAIGMVLLASTPGGATANILSYLSRGNVALNVGLTVINTLLSIIWIPSMVFLAYKVYQGQETSIPLQFSKLIQVLAILIIPIGLGVITKSKFPNMATKLEKYVGKISFAALIFFALRWICFRSGKIESLFSGSWSPSSYFQCRLFGPRYGCRHD